MTEQQQEQPVALPATPVEDRETQRLQLIMSWVILAILTVFGAYVLMGLTTFHTTPGDYWKTLVREQFPVLIGLPMAGLGALFVTLVLRIAVGPVEFEVAGLKFKGGAAPIVFWILSFLCIVISINLLWQEPIAPVPVEDVAEETELTD